MARKLKGFAISVGLASMVLVALPAYAYWSSYEYRNSDGEYRYGIRNGTDSVPLNQEDRKKADRAAKAMNKVEKGVMAGPDGEGDYRPGNPFPN